MTNWGPIGQAVYERTYARTKPDGTKEVWPETVARVVQGNMSLVYGDPSRWTPELKREADTLREYMEGFKILPAGRHLWASGVPGRQYLFNCHVSGWGDKLSTHYEFSFMRLMEGGGVGANYSTHYLKPYGAPRRKLRVHVVCDPTHPDYAKMKADGLLSGTYSHEWTGSFPVEDSREGWAAALVDLLDTYMSDDEVKHADRVYDVSRVRPEGAPLRTFGGTASGPLPFAKMMVNIAAVMNGVDLNVGHLTPLEAMEIDHEIGSCVVAGGNRRSARMSMVRWDDPYIFKFLDCKADPAKHWTTNISVEIDAEFTGYVQNLNVGGDGKARNHAERVHLAAVERMLTNGEPGYWNSDLANEGEPNRIICTNPCGEIGLREWENCNLGHINLSAFALPGQKVDMMGLVEAHRLMTRFLIRATYGDVNDGKQAEMLAVQRRIGVGHFGVQGFFAKLGIRYSEIPDEQFAADLLITLKGVVDDTASGYAHALRIPRPVKTTTMAPTGSIALLPGATSGLQAIFAKRFIRRVRYSDVDPAQWAQVLKFAAEGYKVEADRMAANTWIVEFPTVDSLVAEVEALGLDADTIVESQDEVSLTDALRLQATYQSLYVDNSISYTINVPAEPHQEAALLAGADTPPPPTAERVNVVAAELARWLPQLKGTTLMIDGSRPQAPFERLTADQWAELSAPSTVGDGYDEECATGACPVK
ncbi:ribonucleoside-triphosphate reductase, adenosylcobalamin-dependent [Micromonospora avicenniae]|uniref:ribonucleoside-triphosphate reductase, adenosylcobalamin-dependent n=1 Tax=Micromonospora avicenniae TaxID=1198245 RepID=UPI003330B470